VKAQVKFADRGPSHESVSIVCASKQDHASNHDIETLGLLILSCDALQSGMRSQMRLITSSGLTSKCGMQSKPRTQLY